MVPRTLSVETDMTLPVDGDHIFHDVLSLLPLTEMACVCFVVCEPSLSGGGGGGGGGGTERAIIVGLFEPSKWASGGTGS